MTNLRFVACSACNTVFAVPQGTTATHDCPPDALGEISANPQAQAYFTGAR